MMDITALPAAVLGWVLDHPVLLTTVFAIAGLAATYAVSIRILRSHAAAVLVTLPLLLSIPWDKEFPAVGDALTLFSSTGILYFWLSAEARPAKARRALIGAAAMVVLKPEALVVAVAGVLFQGWRHRKAFSARQVAAALAAVIAAAVLSALIRNPASPSVVLAGLVERIRNGVAWDGTNWVFAGTDIRASLRSATSYGATFYIPLVVVFAPLAYRYRREWWFGPVFVWTSCVLVLTAWAVEPLILRGCPTLVAALLVSFGAVGMLRLREEFPAASRFLAPPAKGTPS